MTTRTKKFMACSCGKVGFVERDETHCPRCNEALKFWFLPGKDDLVTVRHINKTMVQLELL